MIRILPFFLFLILVIKLMYDADYKNSNIIFEFFDTIPTLCALKPYVGHTIGACGTLELALFLSCIEDNFIPKLPSQSEALKCSGGTFLLNYFGFGGNNTSLVIQSEQK